MKKKILYLLLFFYSFFIVMNVNIHDSDFCFRIENSNQDNLPLNDIIMNTMDDVNNYFYGLYDVISIETDHNYALLNIYNIDQDDLKYEYNNLNDLRYDLNNDGYISDADNLGHNDQGICQPVAATMALKYMVQTHKYEYTPFINSNPLDKINIFYDLVGTYIDLGWTGGGALRESCEDYLNAYFDKVDADYDARYLYGNILGYIEDSYNNSLPCIGHISSDNGGHAVTICGYYKKTIEYNKKILFFNQKATAIHYIVAINSGWETVEEFSGIEVPMSWYNANYSYIDLNNLIGITCIYKPV